MYIWIMASTWDLNLWTWFKYFFILNIFLFKDAKTTLLLIDMRYDFMGKAQ